MLYGVAVSGSGVVLGAGVGVAAAGGGVDAGVGDETNEVGGVGGGVDVATRATPAFTTAGGRDGAPATVPCPVANWLTTNAMPSTLRPSPTPIAALPIVCSADRRSAELRALNSHLPSGLVADA